MIIKSMPRKTASFSQLFAYIRRGGEKEKSPENVIFHNVYRTDHRMVAEFEENAKLLRKRKNSNYLYHEVISLKTQDLQLDLSAQKEMLRKIVKQYIKTRASKCLVYAEVHTEHSHNLHFHLMISANEVGSRRRLSLKKYQFNKVKRELEGYVLANFPQLGQEKVIDKPRGKTKSSRKEDEFKKRTSKASEKDELKAAFSWFAGSGLSHKEIAEFLQKGGYEVYKRGKNYGIYSTKTKRKFRLTVLGLPENEFEKSADLAAKIHAVLEAKQSVKESFKAKENGKSKGRSKF